MIQVCSRCGTRWNVRDRQREWCPRCHGALLAPSAHEPPSGWSAPGHDHRVVGVHRSGQRLPPGYRWIAVRPGAAPPPRRGRRQLGPTPRYASIPRWGLVDPALAQPRTAAPVTRPGPSPWMVRATLFTTIGVLAGAALVHLVRYALMIINRTTLLHPVVAVSATSLGVLANIAAAVAVGVCAVVLTGWLIARRSAAFEHRGQRDPRPVWALQGGCLMPFMNLAWAPIFVIELALAEDRLHRLRRTIVTWWLLWLASTVMSVWATITGFVFFTRDTQGIADNTVNFIIAYLLAAASVAAVTRVLFGFERVPVERPAHRWLVVPTDGGEGAGRSGESASESADTVESERHEPAA